MPAQDFSRHKYVFICGLHRSGTTLLAQSIAKLENCAGFRGVPPSVPDEGQNLQDVYQFESEFGGPGKFGFDPRAHLTEASDLLTSANVARLRACWHSYWDTTKTILIEKTPGNLLMTRFLQAAFPNSYFVVIRRHPIPVSMGTPKLGQATATSLHRLFDHWLHCHRLFEEDKKYLTRLYELKYEDYVSDPDKYDQEIAAFIRTNPPAGTRAEVKPDRSNKYFERWQTLLTNSPLRGYYRHVAARYEPLFGRYGYSLFEPLSFETELILNKNWTPPALGRLYCLGADGCASLLRLLSWPSPNTRRRIKATLPEPVVSKIAQIRGKAFAAKTREEIKAS
jgi:hypothetical protein